MNSRQRRKHRRQIQRKQETTTEKKSPQLERAIALDRKALNREQRTLPIAISSNRAVRGEILSHDEGDVDLSRADDNGLPLLWGHDHSQPIGRVRDIRIEDGVMRGLAVFSSNQRAQEVLEMIDEGTLRDASVGAIYDIDSIEFGEATSVIRSWTPLEVSIVSVPADASVGINRSLKEEDMPETTKETDVPEQSGRKLSVVDARRATEKGAKAERERVSQIRDAFGPFLNREGAHSLLDEAIDDGWSVEETMRALLDFAADAPVVPEGAEPIQGAVRRREGTKPAKTEDGNAKRSHSATVDAGEDARDKFMKGAEEAIIARGGGYRTEDGQVDRKRVEQIRAENPFTGMSLLEMFTSEYPRAVGLDVRGLVGEKRVAKVMHHRSGGMTDADLPALVENIIGKMMMVPLTPVEENWRTFTRQTELTDFKQTSRVNLGSASDLKEIASGAGIERGYISDFKEYLKARTFGIELVVEYQTIVNDDVGALVGLPIELRRKANRKVGDLVWGILTENPTLGADATALFHSSHGNLVTSGAIPSVDTLNDAIAAMGTQRAPSPTGDDTNDPGDPLNIRPRYLLVPLALEGRARSLMESTFDPDANAGSQTANTVRGRFEIVSDARLDAFNAAGWFVSADPNQHPTIEVGFVNGQSTPQVMQETDWQTRGIKYAVWMDCDAKPMDYRGLYYNDGVT